MPERDYEYIKVYKPKKIKRTKSYEKKHKGGFGIFKTSEQKFKERLAQTRAIEQKRKLEKIKREFEVENRQRKALRKEESRAQREARIAKLKEHSQRISAFTSRFKKKENPKHKIVYDYKPHPYGGFDSAKQ